MDGADWLTVDPDLNIEAPALREILALWQCKCGDRAMPARSDFGPEELRAHMGWIVLVDVEPAPLRFRYRLIGTELTQWVGRDSTGRYLDELYAPEIYDTAISAYLAAIERRRPVRAHGRFLHAEKGHLPFESLDMPLSADGETVSMIMSRDQIHPPPPRRFGA